MLEIAFGIVLGLAIWHWGLPMIGHILGSGKFWKFVGYTLLIISTVVGVIGLFQPDVPVGVGLGFLVPLILFLIYKLQAKPKKEWFEEMMDENLKNKPK